MSQYDDIREAAEQYIAMELPVIPLCSHNHRGCSDKHKIACKSPGKSPTLKQWSKHAHTEAEDLETWFSWNKYSNLGLVLGQTQDWNIVGVDIDGELGEATFQELSKDQVVPETWEYKTGGGRRLLFTLPEGMETKKNKVTWKEGHEELAFLAQGQQTVLPPSVHPSGRLYEWVEGHSPIDMDAAAAPAWIVDYVKIDRSEQGKLEVKAYSTPVTSMESGMNINHGSRSNALARMVGSLCAGTKASVDMIIASAQQWNLVNCTPPLEYEAVEACCSSIWTSEMEKQKKNLERQQKRQEMNAAILTEHFAIAQANKSIFYRYFQERGRLYSTKKENGPWIACTEEEVKADIHEFLILQDSSIATIAKCNELYQQLQILCTKEYGDGSALDIGRNPNNKTICLQNGVLDWEKGKLVPWSKDFNHTIQFNASWNPKAEETRAYKVWMEALHSWLDEEETIEFLQEYIGYALLPTCKMRTAVFLHGEGANGKSLFLDIVQLLFADCYHITQPKVLATRFGTSAIVDKMLLVCSDIDATYLESTGTLKQIIAGDEIRAEYKGGKEFNVKPVCKLLFSANTLPKTGDKSHGWYSRLQFIKFPHQFAADQRYYDKLMSTMESEEGRSAVLSWAIEGLRRLWARDKFTISTNMLEGKKNYQKDNDNVMAFADDLLTKIHVVDDIQPSDMLMTKPLYNMYKDYCDEGGTKVVSQMAFTSRLSQIGYTSKNVRMKTAQGWRTCRAILGAAWKSEGAEDRISTYNMYAQLLK